jgi:hypothetical protein
MFNIWESVTSRGCEVKKEESLIGEPQLFQDFMCVCVCVCLLIIC